MFIKRLEQIQLTIGVIFLCIFFGAILVQVVSRHFGVSVLWTGEVANYSFIWAVFMGAAVMVNKKEHFNFDLLAKKLKGKSKYALNILIDVILITFSSALFVHSLTALTTFWNYQWVTIPALKMGYVWISLPIMAGTMVIYLAAHVFMNVKLITVRGGE
ncbi:C4-dicarboxylate ABC transporter permease [Alteribacter lacisalsi]|uniref:C4-dicarboxylate ABC transporter permease n=1 Tax=Alteribacter lacisalsi TaxID=2045244 RepID=A0A2W0HGS3_9BACI|nr:TRAP transporter small permease subunit [Alteribacter lacisalsi]PYZ95989.1 C4-dicarboxylate ABC transporter permease [Alteribacter lacisalsi]